MHDRRPIGLAGLGLLGSGIARCLREHGFSVVALERDAEKRRAVPPAEGLTHARDTRDLAQCQLVIESITEDLAAKQELYDDLESCLNGTTPIASNTSGFPITLLQASRTYPGRFVGMHWMTPAHATRFVEVIRGAQTNDATVDLVMQFARDLGKDPALVEKDIPGFIVNRIAYAMYREAIHLLEEGVASAQSIDLACQTSLGVWLPFCGPFRWMDLTGGPALYAKVMETILPTLDNTSEVPPTMRCMQTENKRGVQNGEGFYRYSAEDAADWLKRLHDHATALP